MSQEKEVTKIKKKKKKNLKQERTWQVLHCEFGKWEVGRGEKRGQKVKQGPYVLGHGYELWSNGYEAML